MAAHFARCRSRAIQSFAAVFKQSTRNPGAVKQCALLTGRVPTQLCRENLVQAASRNFSLQANRGVWQMVTVMSCDMGITTVVTTSGSMEECSEEGEDEATSGRKRIKPYELERDDP